MTTKDMTPALDYMMQQVGHPFLEQNPQRFGPKFFDCSGLIYDALHKAGVAIPQSEAIADKEAEWLAKQPGAKVIKSKSDIKAGDFVFFTGAVPNPSQFGGIGHVGMATSNTQYVSAYDTAEGVRVNPIAGDNFVVAIRLGNTSGTPQKQQSSGGNGSGILDIPSEITTFFNDADKFVTVLMWLVNPASWVRIGAFLVGVALLLFAVYAFIKVGQGESPVPKVPQSLPIPVPI